MMTVVVVHLIIHIYAFCICNNCTILYYSFVIPISMAMYSLDVFFSMHKYSLVVSFRCSWLSLLDVAGFLP